jgi:putative restriction endonuclease
VTAPDDWLERIGKIKVWARGGERAPHKPLLLLYVLARLQATGTTRVTYEKAEPELTRLLEEFGPNRKTTPAYPFHRLQSDGLWTVTTTHGGPSQDSPRRLRAAGAVGQLTKEFEEALQKDPRLTSLVARSLLDSSFEESLHADICQSIGLDLESLETAAIKARAATLRRRDPRFRDLVLMAYEYRCAMCGYDGRLGNEAVGLDAAHLRWWAYDGPDTVDNALCLCSFHHKLLDRGVLGVTTDHAVAVSARFVGRGSAAEDLVLRLVGSPLLAPQRGQPLPAADHVAWHGDQVFRSPAREAA